MMIDGFQICGYTVNDADNQAVLNKSGSYVTLSLRTVFTIIKNENGGRKNVGF
ncbi:MAG: hypothetical protein LUE31_08705 [Lachnospiraceae bacterium]|nr:hypothetical protein [Lachnospiraceae bacterium]